MNKPPSPALGADGGKPVRKRPLPYRKLFGPEELRMVTRVFRDSWRERADFGYQGRYEEMYTRRFCSLQGGGFADAVCSGSAALYIALQAIGLEPGDEIVLPPVTDPGGVSPALLLGLRPRVADSRPGSFNMGPEEFSRAATRRTKAVIVAHIGGIPADIAPICRLAAGRGIRVVEDCSQAHGALYRGRRVGTFGDIAVFSTMFSKNHATGGCGGIVYTRRERLYHAARAWADRGKPFASRGFDPKDPRRFNFPALNLNQNELACAIGISTLSRLPGTISSRRRIQAELDAALAGSRAVTPLEEPPGTRSSPFFHTLTVRPERLRVSKETFARAVAAEGVWVNPDYRYVVAEWGWMRGALPSGAATPNASAFRSRSFNVLFNERFSRGDVRDVAAAILKVEAAFLKGG